MGLRYAGLEDPSQGGWGKSFGPELSLVQVVLGQLGLSQVVFSLSQARLKPPGQSVYFVHTFVSL